MLDLALHQNHVDTPADHVEQLVESGPDPQMHGIVRWRCLDLKRVPGERGLYPALMRTAGIPPRIHMRG